LADFSFAKEFDFSAVDLNRNFLTFPEKPKIDNLSVDFIFPLNLDKDSLRQAIDEINISKEKEKNSSWQYVVKKGESLWQISKKFKIPLNDLLYYNDLTENSVIKAGDKLIIHGVKPQATVALQVKKYAGKFVSALNEIAGFVIPTSGFNWGEKHSINGTDISAPCGSEVYSANSGVVIESSDGWNSGYGNYIIIKHQNGSYSLYGHLSLRLVEIGDEVEKGELIGYVGNTGYTIGPTGCHLHFEIRGASNPLLK
jgi:murein DD-endopeptidase MepM/ murein hydrolase activator NlpD